MMKCKLIFTLVLAISSFIALGQSSVIRGTVIDDATGETIIGAAVVIEGTTTGASTDLDGQFQIKVQPGTYNLVASFISYAAVKIEGVVVKDGEATALGTIRMGADVEQLKEVVVTAKAVKNTDAALVTMKRKSANVIDGISAATFKKVGDSDAAGAMSRVTGVSVEGGKYVYVRGLGDRYTKTTLNGMQIPGLDPDRNTVQMDIFPTNVIDNIVVSKSFTAELPADFTGGAVDIATKDFPERKSLNIGVGLGYNPAMNLNENYLTHNGGGTEVLGFDNGARDIPTGGRTNLPTTVDALGNPNGAKGQEYQRILRGFDKQMGGYQNTSLLNSSLSVSAANQKALANNNSLGYSVSLSYKNDFTFYEEAEYNLYGKDQNRDVTELTRLQKQRGSFGENNVLLGGLAGVAYKTQNAKYKVNLMHLQNGEKKTGQFTYVKTDVGTEFNADQYNLEYSERGLTNLLINGTHIFANPDWELDWKVAPTRSVISDPDIRFMRIGDGQNGDAVGTEVGLPQRIWRDLREYNIPVNVDLTKKTKVLERDAKIKFGGSAVYKNRNFEIQTFSFQQGDIDFDAESNPNEYFQDENLFSSDNTEGVMYQPDFIPNNPNKFTSSAQYAAAYGSLEFKPTPLLKAIVGVRAEMFNQFYTGSNQSGDISFNNEKVLEDLNLFPTVNLIYALTENQNLRVSYSRTIARPSFKEMSFAEILDPITGRTFAGGLFREEANINGENVVLWNGNLRSTIINNYDVRWETYPNIGQTISVSAFAKTFKAPIEVVQFLADPGTFQARNVGNAALVGLEIEVKQTLAGISEMLEKFSVNANLTLVQSSIIMSDSERRSRELSARTGETIGDTRQMAGQAPILINVGLNYGDREKGWDANLSYNVQGRTLQYVGFANQTDVYSVPFHSLSFKASKAFGKDNKMSASFKVTNLLNDLKEQVFSNYQATDQIFTRLMPQRTFSVGFSYKLF